MVFSTFYNSSLNLAIRSLWSEPQSAPVLFLLTVYSVSIFGCKQYNQSDFGIDHLMMSMCRVFSCVVGRGCLLWPVCSLDKTLLAFALLHSVLQGQICLLLQVSLEFLLLHSSPLKLKGHLFRVLVLEGLVGLHEPRSSVNPISWVWVIQSAALNLRFPICKVEPSVNVSVGFVSLCQWICSEDAFQFVIPVAAPVPACTVLST